MRLLIVTAGVVAGALVVSGCARHDALAVVSGRVTYDGKRIDDGAVYFVDTASDAVGGFSRIQSGSYRAAVKPGRWAVRITANRRVSGKTDETGIPLVEQYIPQRFNDATELEATIQSSRRLDWSLEGPG